MNLCAYWQLMRFHKPVGIWLLWFPTAWALWVANRGAPRLPLFLVFLFGCIIMRAAGCVLNDIVDRNIDRHVQRTATRPLATGLVTLLGALVILSVLLILALVILLQLPKHCFPYAVIVLGITILYPFCKRFVEAPQLVLGLAFSMGIPMVFVASSAPFSLNFLLLFIINFLWIISYDTMYALVDRDDDLKIGVKSTAILFSPYHQEIILALQTTVHLLWLALAVSMQLSAAFYYAWVLAITILFYQQKLVNSNERSACFKAFLTNAHYGALMWIALILSLSVSYLTPV